MPFMKVLNRDCGSEMLVNLDQVLRISSIKTGGSKLEFDDGSINVVHDLDSLLEMIEATYRP